MAFPFALPPAGSAPRRTLASVQVMQRIAAPMVGGMITAPLLSMFVIPAAYKLLRRRMLGKWAPAESTRHRAGHVPATIEVKGVNP